ncbi:NAD(P)(+) transhydrogenase (Re/Si-specific) subunit beta [Sphingobium sp. JS3065]|uniref:NAD(P)(+) transhydrogenase (Re/Si-specific) subunit beta n=1 Tax=Sphingobium sp. JS3065 TaxID=2970925 RepID=UPI002264E0AF|nr:NAD(P)(+) transhydrogenase (Re/Si-specific) subunit beta [Sphingobium sp. JS3065]UZW55123.1 NAD(P)(+) transhydrogenase (Re/Si-specific) subunit beta [Sphingobium sp. JS3065]
MNPTVLTGWWLAALLFAATLLAPFGGGFRRRAHLAMAGMMAAGAVTLYSHDVMALPQICAALITGGAVGLALGRGVPRTTLPALLTGLIGLAGLAALFIGGAAWRDPHAFGLLDDATDRLRADAAAAMAAAIAWGSMACAGVWSILRRGPVRRGQALVAVVMLLATGGFIGVFVATPDIGLLVACGGTALLAGRGLTKRAMDAGTGPAMALVGGFSGWAVAASAFLMENMAMAVAGGLTGAAGSLFCARLCGGPGRKGLADAERHP